MLPATIPNDNVHSYKVTCLYEGSIANNGDFLCVNGNNFLQWIYDEFGSAVAGEALVSEDSSGLASAVASKLLAISIYAYAVSDVVYIRDVVAVGEFGVTFTVLEI